MWRNGKIGAVVALALVLALGSGCDPLVQLNVDKADNGLVVVLPGIDGPSLGTASVMASVATHTEMAVGQYNWTIPFAMLINQRAIGRNHAMARHLAERIVDYKAEHPGAPVYLIGHSGGTAIAVWTAEALPAGVEIEGMFLLASSLSPGYNLSRAIAKTRGQIVNVYSSHDNALLGNGTSIIGTMDGRHSPSAGKLGFSGRGGFGYNGKLVQIGWTPAMRKAGYFGDHFSVCSSAFVADYLAPRMEGLPDRPTGPALATRTAAPPRLSPQRLASTR